MATSLVANPFLIANTTVDSGAAVALTGLAVSGGGTNVSSGQMQRADVVFLTVEDNSIRWTSVADVEPTSALGHAVAAGSSFEVSGTVAINNLRIIRDGSGNAIVQATFYSYANS